MSASSPPVHRAGTAAETQPVTPGTAWGGQGTNVYSQGHLGQVSAPKADAHPPPALWPQSHPICRGTGTWGQGLGLKVRSRRQREEAQPRASPSGSEGSNESQV